VLSLTIEFQVKKLPENELLTKIFNPVKISISAVGLEKRTAKLSSSYQQKCC
jgi:hypothetical protein